MTAASAIKVEEIRLGLADAAKLTGRSRQWIRQLVRGSYIAEPGKAGYLAIDVVQGVLRHAGDEQRRASQSAAQGRVTDARARSIEIRNAQAERDLIPLDDAITATDFMVGWFVSAATGLPARCTDDLAIRRRIEDEIDTLLNDLAELATQAELALNEGRDPFDPRAARRGRARP